MSSAGTMPEDKPKSNLSVYAPLITWVAGFLTLIICLIVQLFTLNHGTSGQLSIDAGMHVALWPGLIGAILLAVGWVAWVYFNKDSKFMYMYLFLMSFCSYALANVAMFFSTRQVTVANT